MFNAGSDPADLLITPLLGSSGLNGYMSIAPIPFPRLRPAPASIACRVQHGRLYVWRGDCNGSCSRNPGVDL